MVTADTITLLFCPVMFICRDFFQNFVLGAIGCNMEGYLQGNFIFGGVAISLLNAFTKNLKWLCFYLLISSIGENHRLVTFLITAVLNLCAVSYDRLTAIVLPRESRITMRGAKIIMVFTWLTGFTLAMPLAIYRNYRVRKKFTAFAGEKLPTRFCLCSSITIFHLVFVFVLYCLSSVKPIHIRSVNGKTLWKHFVRRIQHFCQFIGTLFYWRWYCCL